MRCCAVHPLPAGYVPEVGKRVPLKFEGGEVIGDAEIVGVSPDGKWLMLQFEISEPTSSKLRRAIHHLSADEVSMS